MGTMLSGCFCSRNLDTHGETIDINGLDISTLAVDGKAIFEHKKDLPDQIVGRVIFAKKLFSEKDCDTSDQLKWWNKVQCDMVYGIVELFDGHKGADAVISVLNHDLNNTNEGQKSLVGFSIDGQVLEKDGNVIKNATGRDVAISYRPANKMAQASLYTEQPSSPLDVIKTLFKNESNQGNILSPLDEKILHLESLLKTDDLTEHAKNMIKEGLANLKPKGQETINGRPKANLQNEGKPLKPEGLPRVPKAVPVPGRKESFPNPYGPTSKKNIGNPKVISGEEFKAKIQAFKEQAKKQNEAVRQSYNDPRPTPPVQKLPSMGNTQPKLSVIQGGKQEAPKTEAPKTSWVKEVRGDTIKKAESAGGIPAAPGSNTGMQALTKEADDLYKNWDKKDKFEDFLSKKIPHLSKKEIKAFAKAYVFKKNKEKEKALEEI